MRAHLHGRRLMSRSLWIKSPAANCFPVFVTMPSGPALMMEQQWEPVVWRKSVQSSTAAAAVNQARRQGEDVETSKKLGTGNKSATVTNPRKLDDHSETFRHHTVSHDFKLALQQARLTKKWTQAQLAASVNEKAAVVNDYESGRAIPNGALVVKLSRALGARLPKAK